jgi:mRNA-degrading endonuclease toxin of MazEF toxin-antitoxin module
MPTVNPGEVWMVDFGMAAKVRPALLLTGKPADDELDLVTVLLHTTALRRRMPNNLHGLWETVESGTHCPMKNEHAQSK